MLTYPDSAELFEKYMKSQQDECDALEHDVMGVTMILMHDNSL